MAAQDMHAYIYTADDGRQYVIGAMADVFAQQGVSLNPKIGGADYTGSPKLDSLPLAWRPRRVYVRNGSRIKQVTCLDPDSDLYRNVETTIDLLDRGLVAPVTYTRFSHLGEKPARERNPAG